MKKIYKIRITGCSKPGIWYERKNHCEFEAELKSSAATTSRVIAFYVNPCQFVHLIDCEVVGERLVEIYQKPNA